MEGRIKLQKTLSLISKLPSGVQLEGSGVRQEGERWGVHATLYGQLGVCVVHSDTVGFS